MDDSAARVPAVRAQRRRSIRLGVGQEGAGGLIADLDRALQVGWHVASARIRRRMPVYLTPGVYVELLGPTPVPATVWAPSAATTRNEGQRIPLAGPGAAAFLGLTERAPAAADGVPLTAHAVLVEGLDQYRDRFGSTIDGALLPDAVHGYFANGGRRAYIVSFGAVGTTGERGAPTPDEVAGRHEMGTGIEALMPLADVTLLCAPDVMGWFERGAWQRRDVAATHDAMIAFCEARQTCVALLDTPRGLTPDAASRWRDETGLDRMHAAMFYPWIQVSPAAGPPRLVPPCGHVAGVLMRTFETDGPHATPANQPLADAVDLEMRIPPVAQDALNPRGVNVLRVFPDSTVRIWGTRTLSGDAAGRLLQDRTLTHAIVRSITEGATWSIFRRHDAALADEVCTALYGFLQELWRRGSLVGESEQDAFYVSPGRDTGGAFIVQFGVAMRKARHFTPMRAVFASDQGPDGTVASEEERMSPRATPVFVSYDRDDWKDFVEDLVRMLRDEGFTIWVDQHILRGGQDWMDAINEALVACPVMLLCVSPDAVASKHVKLEYRYFFNEGKPILPVLCRPTVLPAELRGLQYIDYADSAGVVARLRELLQSLGEGGRSEQPS